MSFSKPSPLSSSSSPARLWYALKVHACCERRVEELLQKHLWVDGSRMDIDTFLPVQKAWVDAATGLVERNRLLVDGLVFVRFSPQDKTFTAIRRTPYVLDFYLTSESHLPESIPEEQMSQFRFMLSDSPDKVELVNRIRKGDRVQVVSGSLKGLVGTLEEECGKSRICVELQILGKYARTHIDKSSTVLCSDIVPASSPRRVEAALRNAAFREQLETFRDSYDRLSGMYLKRLSDDELRQMVRLYREMLSASNTLPVLRSRLWSKNPYCYQHLFADVYRELAERVKATRKKEERAPLLHSLHLLCDQVSERAYTIKTNAKWVEESIESINRWFMRYQPKGNTLPYILLLLDEAEGKKTQNSYFKTQNSPLETNNSKLILQNSKLDPYNSSLILQNSKLIDNCVQRLYEELSGSQADSLTPMELSDRLEVLSAICATSLPIGVSRQSLKQLLKQWQGRLAQSQLQHPYPNSPAACCAKASNALRLMEQKLK